MANWTSERLKQEQADMKARWKKPVSPQRKNLPTLLCDAALNNAEIARAVGLSRERIRQIRNYLISHGGCEC